MKKAVCSCELQADYETESLLPHMKTLFTHESLVAIDWSNIRVNSSVDGDQTSPRTQFLDEDVNRCNVLVSSGCIRNMLIPDQAKFKHSDLWELLSCSR